MDVRMCGCVYVWMCGCVDVRMCGCIYVWMCRCADVLIGVRKEEISKKKKLAKILGSG